MRILAFLALLLTGLGAQAAPIDVDAAVAALQRPGTLLIDVRTPEETADGMLKGAVNIPHEQIGQRIAALTTDPETTIVVYCRSGRRSTVASEALEARGYRQVINGGAYGDLQAALQAGH